MRKADMTEKKIARIIEKREKKKFISQLQTMAEKEGHIPPMPFLLLRKTARPFHYAGGVYCGVLLGLMSVLVSFFISLLLNL
jgi:hypothetical protein